MNNPGEKQPQIDSSLTWRLLDGDAVIVSPRTGKIRVLNQVGANIWQMLAEGKSTQEIAASLSQEYGISNQQAQTDVTVFLEDLTKRGLVSWTPGK